MSYGNGWGYGRWAPYVPVSKRRAQAAAYAKQLEKKRGQPLNPIAIEGRAIARSFWGKAWCDNLEAYSDFENRLPRGRTYVRNGSVIDLQIESGKVTALVSGSEVYEVDVAIERLPSKAWRAIQRDCARSINSLIDLLQGRFDRGVMARLSRTGDGLFPRPAEIKMSCSCPDYAGLCKHVAAVLYGVGARLDHAPELLFTLRNVDHFELIGEAASAENLDSALAGDSAASIDAGELGELFGIELETAGGAADECKPSAKRRRRSAAPPKSRRTATAKQPAQSAAAAPSSRRSTVRKSKSTLATGSNQSKKSAAQQASIGKSAKKKRSRSKVVKAALSRTK
jgi:uncharacterized Zn finger protein